MEKRTKWTVRIAAIAVSLIALFVLAGCREAGTSTSANVNVIDGTYKVSAGDLATTGSDADVAQNVANDMMIATLELRCSDPNSRVRRPPGRALS